MAFLKLRVATPISVLLSVLLIVLGLPVSIGLLFVGVVSLIPGHPDSVPDGLAPFTTAWLGAAAPALVVCGISVFFLLMAIAAFRGLLDLGRKQTSRGEDQT